MILGKSLGMGKAPLFNSLSLACVMSKSQQRFHCVKTEFFVGWPLGKNNDQADE